ALPSSQPMRGGPRADHGDDPWGGSVRTGTAQRFPIHGDPSPLERLAQGLSPTHTTLRPCVGLAPGQPTTQGIGGRHTMGEGQALLAPLGLGVALLYRTWQVQWQQELYRSINRGTKQTGGPLNYAAHLWSASDDPAGPGSLSRPRLPRRGVCPHQ